MDPQPAPSAAETAMYLICMIGICLCGAVCAGCDDVGPLRTIPDAGPTSPDAGPDVVPRDPVPTPDAGPCHVEILWPGGPVVGECRPGWVDHCTGTTVQPVLPTAGDTDCDGRQDGDCDPVAWITVLDTSGSMNTNGYLPSADAAICDLTPDPRVTRGLVTFGHSAGLARLGAPWGPEICTPGDRGGSSNETGPQALLDAPGLLGGWPDGHVRGMTLITDHEPASSQLLGQVVALCTAGRITIDLVTHGHNVADWQALISACNGRAAPLTPWITAADVGGLPLPCEGAP